MCAIQRPFSIEVMDSVQDEMSATQSKEVAANRRFLKYGIKRKSTSYICSALSAILY